MSWIEKYRAHPYTILFITSFGLFVEELLYGMVAPLASESPVHVCDEHVISTLYGAYALGLIIATPILGIVTERTGRRKPMILGGLLLSASAVLFYFGLNQPMLFAARLLQGAGAACTWTAGLALIAGYFVKDRVRAMGWAMLGATTGSIVGPLVGGELFEKGGYAAPFYFAFVLLAIDVALRFAIPTTVRTALKPWKETFSELGGIITDKSVLSAAFAVALAAAAWALMEPLFPMHVIRIGNATPTVIGLLFTVSNLLYALLAPVVPFVSDRIGVRQTTVVGLVMTAIVLPSLAITPNIVMAGIVLCLVTIGYAFTINPTSAELGDAVDRRGSASYAVAYAVYNLAYSFGMIAVDSYVQFVTDGDHKLPLVEILLIVSGLFVLCVPLFLVKPSATATTEAATEEPTTATASDAIQGENKTT